MASFFLLHPKSLGEVTLAIITSDLFCRHVKSSKTWYRFHLEPGSILIGSYAREDSKPGSDLDLLVIVDDAESIQSVTLQITGR